MDKKQLVQDKNVYLTQAFIRIFFHKIIFFINHYLHIY